LRRRRARILRDCLPQAQECLRTITPPKPELTATQVSTSSTGNHVPKPAQLVPAGAELVAIFREMSDADCRADDDSDLDGLMSETDWETYDAYSNIHDFQYTKWTNELLRVRIDKGPPLGYVVAKTFVDVNAGKIRTLEGVEQCRTPYDWNATNDAEGEPYTPIPLGEDMRLRVVHCYDPLLWKPKGNWARGRFVHRAKITRPPELWAELRKGVRDARQELAKDDWEKDEVRREDVDSRARKRKILRDRKDRNHIPGSRALAAAAFESDAWKPYLQEMCKLADLVVPPMPMFEDTVMDHLLPLPKPTNDALQHGIAALQALCTKMRSGVSC
jgi:hypothetical protein